MRRVRVRADGGLDPGFDPPKAECVLGDSVEVSLDSDGDGFRDGDDPCEEVTGSGVFFSGCPDLDRAVTASYADGVVSGTVSFVDGRATSSACTEAWPTKIVAFDLSSNGDPNAVLGETNYSPADGTYSIDLDTDLPVGTGYTVHLYGQVDPDAGYCGHANAGPHTVADPDPDRDEVRGEDDDCPQVDDLGDTVDGCPELERTVTASYAGGAITGAGHGGGSAGRLRPVRACRPRCGPTRSVTGSWCRSVRPTTTTATGSYTIALGDAAGGGLDVLREHRALPRRAEGGLRGGGIGVPAGPRGRGRPAR